MSNTTQLPADVRERVLTMLTAMEWTALVEHHDGRWYACCPWCGGENPDDDETPSGRAGHAERCELAAVIALLRTPRGEGDAMDADEMWNHWTSGHEDAALQGLRTASDDEAHRFLSMIADWQRCPMPSDHDAIAARRGEGGEALAVEVIRLNTALALLKTEENAAHVEAVATNAAWLEELERIAAFATRTPALRLDAALCSEAQGEERASKYDALLAFADAISDAVWGGERAWEQDGGLERLSQKVRRWAKERAALRSEAQGVTRCRICCERPAALTLCTECADEALWRSIYDQWLAEEATNARFRAIVHEWRCGMCGHWSPRRCRARCQRCGAVRGYGYRDREAVEERTVITYPTDRSESDE